MLTEIYKNEVNGERSTIGQIINITLTELGGGLYTYMYMLHGLGRKAESDLIENLRSMIFDIRDKFANGKVTKLDIASELNKVHDLLNVQITMLRSNEQTKWEAGVFKAYLNDLIDFKYLMNPNKDK